MELQAREPGEPLQTYSPCLGVAAPAPKPAVQSLVACRRAARSYAGAASASCSQCPFLEKCLHPSLMEPGLSGLGNQGAEHGPVLLTQLPGEQAHWKTSLALGHGHTLTP